MVDFLARTDEHRMLRDTVRRVFAESGKLEHNLSQSGLLALPFKHSDGGLREEGNDGTELAIAFAAKGEAYGIDNILLQAVLGGGIMANSSSPDRTSIIQNIIHGEAKVVVGVHEPGSRSELNRCRTSAQSTESGWMLNGTKTLVLGAESASHLLIVARIESRANDPRNGIFQIDLQSLNADWRHYRLRDGSSASDVTFNNVLLPDHALIVSTDAFENVLENALAMTRFCLAAEASGLLQSTLSRTATYVNDRKQFGQPIGSFQVVQHKLADLATLADQSAALVSKMARNTADIEAINGSFQAVAAMGMSAAKIAIQMHGGYGMTEDLPFGQVLRRMMTIALLFEVSARN